MACTGPACQLNRSYGPTQQLVFDHVKCVDAGGPRWAQASHGGVRSPLRRVGGRVRLGDPDRALPRDLFHLQGRRRRRYGGRALPQGFPTGIRRRLLQ
jgi:hypothetical protein